MALPMPSISFFSGFDNAGSTFLCTLIIVSCGNENDDSIITGQIPAPNPLK